MGFLDDCLEVSVRSNDAIVGWLLVLIKVLLCLSKYGIILITSIFVVTEED